MELGAIPAGDSGEDGLGICMELAQLGVTLGGVVEAAINLPDFPLAGETKEVHPHGLGGSEIEKIRRSKNPAGSLSSNPSCDLIAFHDKGNISLEC